MGYFSEKIIVWSVVVPWVTWQGARDAGAVEQARTTLNTCMSHFVRTRAGVVVHHRQLEGDNRQLMREDRVQLIKLGLIFFFLDSKTGSNKPSSLGWGSMHLVGVHVLLGGGRYWWRADWEEGDLPARREGSWHTASNFQY